MIDTREELVNALVEAAELEHGLLLQYLYAAFSLKRSTEEVLSSVQLEQAVRWEAQILRVAHEEMFHLAHVNNILVALGAPAWFGRPNFPQQGNRYPEPFQFELERFSTRSLAKFCLFELPVGEKLPDEIRQCLHQDDGGDDFRLFRIPDALLYSHIGELYGEIAHCISSSPLGETLFVDQATQVEGNWGLSGRPTDIFKVVDRATALKALERIVQNGEGTPAARQGSHYQTFVQMLSELQEAQQATAGLDFARAVCSNPILRSLPGTAGATTLLESPSSVATAKLFDGVYGAMLMLLLEGFAPSEQAAAGGERVQLVRNSARRLMSAVIRPLAEILTALPVAEDGDPRRAGPCFGLYGPLLLPPIATYRWPFIQDRLAGSLLSVAAAIEEVAKVAPKEIPRLERVADALTWTLQRLDAASGGSQSLATATDEQAELPDLGVHIEFSGWLQVRLATDPDPSDEPRGVSGYIHAGPGEPDLDRRIRFQPPFVLRSHSPDGGVQVQRVMRDGAEITGSPLIGASVDLEGAPIFKGENGIVAEDGFEPIVPFILSIKAGNQILLRRSASGSPDYVKFPFPGLQAKGIEDAPAEFLESVGIPDPDAYFADRAKILDNEYASATDEEKRLFLQQRLGTLRRIGARYFGAVLNYQVRLGPEDAPNPGLSILPGLIPDIALSAEPWIVQMAIGAWDPDTQFAFAKGTLWIKAPPL